MSSKPLHEGKQKFLRAHKDEATVSRAAQYAGVHRRTVYKWNATDPKFALAWEKARETFVQELEMRAYWRAIDGSDQLLMFLLRSYRPGTYTEKKQQEGIGSGALTIAELAEKVRQWLCDRHQKPLHPLPPSLRPWNRYCWA